jgi:hypothetical protein
MLILSVNYTLIAFLPADDACFQVFKQYGSSIWDKKLLTMENKEESAN